MSEPAQSSAYQAFLESARAELGRHGEYLRGLDLTPNQVQVDVDGLMYTSAKWPTGLGLAIWSRLVNMFGSSATQALAGGDVMQALARSADWHGVEPLFRDCLVNMKCAPLRGQTLDDASGPVAPRNDPKTTGVFDKHFAGEYVHLLKVFQLGTSHNLMGPTLGSLSMSGSPTKTTTQTDPAKESPSRMSAS